MRESGSKDGMHSTAIPCLLTPIRVRGVITRRLYGDTRKETATRRIWQHKFRPRLVVTCSMQRQRDTGTKSFGDLKIRRGLSRASLRAREIQRSTFDQARSCRTPFPKKDAYWRELNAPPVRPEPPLQRPPLSSPTLRSTRRLPASEFLPATWTVTVQSGLCA